MIRGMCHEISVLVLFVQWVAAKFDLIPLRPPGFRQKPFNAITYGSFGPTIMRMNPFGMVWSRPPPTIGTGPETECNSAICNLTSGEPESSVNSFITTPTLQLPPLPPLACSMRGSDDHMSCSSAGAFVARSGSGNFWVGSHFAWMRAINIAFASHDPSEALGSYNTSKRAGGIPAMSLANSALSRRLGGFIRLTYQNRSVIRASA